MYDLIYRKKLGSVLNFVSEECKLYACCIDCLTDETGFVEVEMIT